MDRLSQISSSADITTANFTVIMALINGLLSHFRPIYDVDGILFIIIIVPYEWASSNGRPEVRVRAATQTRATTRVAPTSRGSDVGL